MPRKNYKETGPYEDKPYLLQEHAIKLCLYGAKHGNMMVHWVANDLKIPVVNGYSPAGEVAIAAHNEAKKRNPDKTWICSGDGSGSYEAYHRIRTERPEMEWDEIWDYFKSMHDEKFLWHAAMILVMENWKPLKKYPTGKYISWIPKLGYFK